MIRIIKNTTLATAIISLMVQTSSAQTPKAVVTYMDGAQDTCRILFANDSVFAMWRSDGPYTAETAGEYGVKMDPSDVDRVVIRKESHFWSSVGTGFLIGAGGGAVIGLFSGNDESGFIRFTAGEKALLLGGSFGVAGAIIGGVIAAVPGSDDELVLNGEKERYIRALPVLQKNAILESAPLYASTRLHSRLRLRTFRYETESRPEKQGQWVPSCERIHLTISGGTMLAGSAAADMISAFNKSGFGGSMDFFGLEESYPSDQGKAVSWSISGEYSLVPQWRLGLSWSSVPEGEIHGSGFESEKTSGESYGLICTYVAVPSDMSLSSRFEIAMTGGLTYTLMKVGGSLDFSGSSVGIISESESKAGFLGSLSCDYYFSKIFSFQVKLTEYFMPWPVNVREVQYTDQWWGETEILVAHGINFSRLDLSSGLRFHF